MIPCILWRLARRHCFSSLVRRRIFRAPCKAPESVAYASANRNALLRKVVHEFGPKLMLALSKTLQPALSTLEIKAPPGNYRAEALKMGVRSSGHVGPLKMIAPTDVKTASHTDLPKGRQYGRTTKCCAIYSALQGAVS